MALFLSSLQLIARRSMSRWKLLSAVVLGVLLAVSIMSATVLYFDSLRNLALRYDFSTQAPEDLDILIEAKQPTLDAEHDAGLIGFVEPRIDDRLGWFLADRRAGLKSSTFFPANPGDELPPGRDNRRRSTFVSIPELESQAVLVQGRWADVVVWEDGAQTLTLEAVVPVETAEEFGLELDDVFEAAPYWEAAHERISARIVGIYSRIDAADSYWRVVDTALGLGDTSFQFAQLTVPRETMVTGLGPYFPGMTSEYAWHLDVDTDLVRASASTRAQGALDAVRNEFNADLNSFRMRTTLGGVLDRFDTRLFFNQVPMFVVLVLIVLVVLYYISMLAGLLVDAQRAEIGLLRSRGATSRQIVAVYATEAFVLAALAIPAGPYIAAAAISAVGALPMFSDLNAGSAIPTEVTGLVFRMAALGGGLSLLALLVPSLRAARVGLLEHRQALARPPRLPAFQRYYLDLGTLGIVLFLFWQLQQRGSFVAVRLFGDAVVNQVVLAVPAMFLVAAGLVLLRIFPISMELLGRLFSTRALSRVASPALVLGLWQMARSPAHHARLSLLLILTAALGVFAASFRASLDNSFEDRVYYETGADVRLLGVKFPPNSRGRSVIGQQSIAEAPGVDLVTPVVRGGGTLTGLIGSTFRFLAVDPREFTDVAWTRPDFAPLPIEEAVARLDLADTTGVEIPAGATVLYARIRPLSSRGEVNVLARISDEQSRMYTLNLGTVAPRSASPAPPSLIRASADSSVRCPRREEPSDPAPWCTIGGSLRWLGIQGGSQDAALKLEFLSVSKINDVDGTGGLRSGAMLIDEIGVRFQDGSTTVLDGFDDLEKWGSLGTTLNDFGATITTVRDATGAPVPGEARFSWGDAGLRHLQGVLVGRLRQPIPALASASFMELENFDVGDEVEVRMRDRQVLVEIVGTVDYFPTLDPNKGPFLVTDIRSTWRALSVDDLGGARDVSEYWVSGDTEVMSADEIGQRARERRVPYTSVEVRADLLATSDIDPLSAAGWRALLAIAFFTVLVVSAIGFLVHAQVTFHGRKAELALLRATGLSMRQVLGLVLLEQALVIGTAFVIGVFMGTRLGATIMPYLGTSGEGLRVVPPLVQQVDWGAFGTTFGIVGGVFMIVVLALLVSVYRMSLHMVLRLGER